MLAGPVVTNNTPLVALWNLRRLDLFQLLWGGVFIPPAVHAEFLAIETTSRRSALEESPWIQIETIADSRRVLAFTGLDRGEAEVLALAEEREARIVLLDERKARRFARRIGLELTGTLGTLLIAKEKGFVDSVSHSIRTLTALGLYLEPRLVNRVVMLANEAPISTAKELDTP